MKKRFFLLFVIMLLAGCTASGEEETARNEVEPGDMQLVLDYHASIDKRLKLFGY